MFTHATRLSQSIFTPFQIVCLLLLGSSALQASDPPNLPHGVSQTEWQGVAAQMQAHQHQIAATEDGYQAKNPGQQWQTRFDHEGFLIKPQSGGWSWGLSLASYGLAGAEQMITHEPAITTEGNRLEYRWGETITEWMINDQRGLEHGFTLRQRPAGEGDELRLSLKVRGDLKPVALADGSGASFVDEQGASVLDYSGLKVVDAVGSSLTARVAVDNGKLQLTVNDRHAVYPITIDPIAQQAYIKASNTDADDNFGYSVAISGDTLVVGASGEDSSAIGVNGYQTDNSLPDAGAVYVFVRNGSSWSQQAYLKASNTEANDIFGHSVAIAGETLAVGAPFEGSSATGVNGNQADNSRFHSGAVYVFIRNGGVWSQQAYIKSSNSGAGDEFGNAVTLSGDTLAVGAHYEDSNTTGVDGNQLDYSAANSGAVYVFVRSGNTWNQQAYLKASNTEPNDRFGEAVALSGDTLAVGAWGEDSNATGINANQADNTATDSGAVYMFVRNGAVWTQQAYLKASNTGASDKYGQAVALSDDTLVVGTPGEDSNTTGVNGNQSDNSMGESGAAYVYVRNGSSWSQQAYIKSTNTDAGDEFGRSVALSGDFLVVGARWEDSNANGVNGNQSSESLSASGAAYLFVRNSGIWSPQAYLKASNAGAVNFFGAALALSGDTLAVGGYFEESNATGVNGNQTDNSADRSGAVYVFNLNAQSPPLASFTATPSTGPAPLTVTLDYSGSNDPDGAIVDYAWQVNGQPLPVASADTATTKKLSFPTAGAYNIQLTVTDNDGFTGSANRTVIVEPSTSLPQTLILTNQTKLVELYGATRADTLLAKLDTLAAHAGVTGKVILIEQDPAARVAATNRGSGYDDKYLANALSDTIQQLIRREWDANNQLRYLLLVGDDRVIPFHRVDDGTWFPDSWTLTDDYYADHPPYNRCTLCANPDIYLPDIPIGRLVETPEQMSAAIDRFLARDSIPLDTATVVGWDFLIDGAREHCTALQKGGLAADCTLIGNQWTAAQLKERLFGLGSDTAIINLHADYDAYQSPLLDLANPKDLLGGVADLANTLYASSGCHAGKNVPLATDWPEAYLQRGASYIGNTGYGWGGEGIILSERLIQLLSEQIAQGAQSAGQALQRAKQRYHAGQRSPTEHDAKVLLEATLYGLPMMRLQGVNQAPATTIARLITDRARTSAGLSVTSISYAWPVTAPVTTPAGSYYTLEGSAIAPQDQAPILPQLTRDLTAEGKLHGIVFRGGNYSVYNSAPPKQHYTTTTGHQTPATPFSAPGWYPSTFFAANTTELQDGELHTLIATAGQVNPTKTQGQQRIFSRMDFEANHHASDSDWTAPTVYLADQRLEGYLGKIQVVASDASGVAEVIIAYTDGKGSWNSLNLIGSGSTWSGEVAATSETEFFIQAVDAIGNVAINDNTGAYFRFTVPASGCQEIGGNVTIANQTYTGIGSCHATNTLSTSGAVQVGIDSQAADVSFSAGGKVDLKEGFKVKSGSRFRAYIR